jgi:hypothetical protein
MSTIHVSVSDLHIPRFDLPILIAGNENGYHCRYALLGQSGTIEAMHGIAGLAEFIAQWFFIIDHCLLGLGNQKRKSAKLFKDIVQPKKKGVSIDSFLLLYTIADVF